MKKMLLSLCLLSVMILPGCDATRGLQSAYNMTNCDYTYRSISHLKIMDMDVSDGISPIAAMKLVSILNGSASSIPLDFTLNLNVHNPNPTEAAFHSFQYIFQVDDVEFSKGRVSQPFHVSSSETKSLPIQIGTDLGELIETHSHSKIVQIAKNLIGIGNEKSQITVYVKPTIRNGNSEITSPVYLPISFTLGENR